MTEIANLSPANLPLVEKIAFRLLLAQYPDPDDQEYIVDMWDEDSLAPEVKQTLFQQARAMTLLLADVAEEVWDACAKAAAPHDRQVVQYLRDLSPYRK